MKKNQRPLDHSLGFHSCLTQTSFESPSPSSENHHLKLRRPLDFGLSVKGREAKLLVSCNVIGSVFMNCIVFTNCSVFIEIEDLSTFGHSVKRPLKQLHTTTIWFRFICNKLWVLPDHWLIPWWYHNGSWRRRNQEFLVYKLAYVMFATINPSRVALTLWPCAHIFHSNHYNRAASKVT
jgi:hypothetical protein